MKISANKKLYGGGFIRLHLFFCECSEMSFLYFAMYACQIFDNRHFVLKGRAVDNQ